MYCPLTVSGQYIIYFLPPLPSATILATSRPSRRNVRNHSLFICPISGLIQMGISLC